MARRDGYNPLLKSYPDSEKINAVSMGAETLYTRLIAASDDAGRYYGEAGWIIAKLFTSRMVRGEVTAADVEKWVSELESVSLLRRYRAATGTFLELLDVFKTIRRDVKPHLLFPEPVPETVTDAERIRNGPGPRTGTLDRDRDLEQDLELNTGGKPRSVGIFNLLTRELLENDEELAAWVSKLSRKPELGIADDDRGRLRIAAAWERAKDEGDKPVAFFIGIVKQGLWHHINNDQEERARRRLRAAQERAQYGEPLERGKPADRDDEADHQRALAASLAALPREDTS